MDIWDTAGQEKFNKIPRLDYKDKDGILVVYDITDRDSFENLNVWLDEIEANSNKKVSKLLIGNKTDLFDERKISYNEAKDFAASKGMQYIETSAKTNYNVKEAFELLAQQIIDAKIAEEQEKKEKKDKQIKEFWDNYDSQPKKKRLGCGCCYGCYSCCCKGNFFLNF